MARLLRLTLTALLFAAPVLFSLTPRPAQAFCITCFDLSVIEYVNENTGHYLLLPAGDPEVAIVEGGGAGPGWVRTGNDFTTTTYATLPVCRFYSPVFNTHFYTADAAECEAVKHNSDWVYEKSPFNTLAPYDATCSGAAPVYRFYHAGDHRYTADTGIRDAMLAKGWIYEGIAFCVARGGREAVTTLAVNPTRIDSLQACLSSAGYCTALDSLAPMPNQVPPFLPPDYITPNPAYPANVGQIVGKDSYLGPLFTSQPADSPTIGQHSFVSPYATVYVNGSDRTGGDYASISPMVVLPGVAGSSGDQRVFVWRGVADQELRVSAGVSVGVTTQLGPGSQAYGHPQLQFGDAKSGHSFLVTVQAFGTVPPGDFVGSDARTGEPIVSTVFRPNPMFGRVLSGSFIRCPGDGTTCAPTAATAAPPQFAFSLQRADFQVALDQARTVDPALSADRADYFLGRVAFHNETYLDAQLGTSIVGLTAEIWYVE